MTNDDADANSTVETEAGFITPEAANKMLPYVRAIVVDIVELYRDVHDRRSRLGRIRQQRRTTTEDSPYEAELRQAERDLDADIERLEGYVEELRAVGVDLRDPVKGLVDFPALIDGREVALCWSLGEDRVSRWHELDERPGRFHELTTDE